MSGLFFAAVLALVALSAAAAAAVEGAGAGLFLSNPRDAMEQVPNCQADDDTLLTCDRVDVDFGKVAKAEALKFPSGHVLRRSTQIPMDSGLAAYKFEDANGTEAVLTYTTALEDEEESQVLTGTMTTTDGRAFVIESCGDDCTLWIEESEEEFTESEPPSHEIEEESRLELSPEVVRLMAESRQSSAPVVHNIFFYYTAALKARETNINAYVQQQVAETNLVLSQSRIPLSIRAFCIEEINVREDDKILTNFNAAKGSLNALYGSADLAILLASGPVGRTCGQASALNVLRGRGVRTAWSGRRCNVYTLAHELGHLWGCWHDRETLGSPRAPRNFEYGFRSRSTGVKTVMAYGGSAFRRYIQAFSTGSFQVSGQVIGDAQNDCRRMVLDTRLAISRLGNEQTRCGAGTSCSDRSQACPFIARLCSRSSTIRRFCPKTCNTC